MIHEREMLKKFFLFSSFKNYKLTARRTSGNVNHNGMIIGANRQYVNRSRNVSGHETSNGTSLFSVPVIYIIVVVVVD